MIILFSFSYFSPNFIFYCLILGAFFLLILLHCFIIPWILSLFKRFKGKKETQYIFFTNYSLEDYEAFVFLPKYKQKAAKFSKKIENYFSFKYYFKFEMIIFYFKTIASGAVPFLLLINVFDFGIEISLFYSIILPDIILLLSFILFIYFSFKYHNSFAVLYDFDSIYKKFKSDTRK